MNAHLFILSAPSGAGKTTLCSALLTEFPDIRYSISYTARAPRLGETDGKDYHFISEEAFVKGIEENHWAEWAKVHDNYYGTSACFLDETLASGVDVLLDIDVQGMLKIIPRYPDAVTIFIMPPSMETLSERLKNRGTDSREVIAKRLKNAEGEISQCHHYRHIIINDDLQKATAELFGIIRMYQLNKSNKERTECQQRCNSVQKAGKST